MTRKGRRWLFYLLILAFIILGSGVLLYSQGYQLDLATFQLRKVGAIYIRSFPDNAAITLNGKSINNDSWLLQHGTLINNLFPKMYRVQLSLNDYEPWQQTVTVKPPLVNDLAYAVLVPQSSTQVATSSVKNFWLVNQQLILEDSQGNLTSNGQTLPGSTVVGWSDDFTTLLTLDTQTQTYFLDNLSSGRIASEASFLQGTGLTMKPDAHLVLDQGDGSKLLLQQDQALTLINTTEGTATTLQAATSSGTLGTFAASSDFIAWSLHENGVATPSSLVKIYDPGTRKLVTTLTLTGSIIKLAFATPTKLAILQSTGKLSLYDILANQRSDVADDVQDFQFTADGTMVAARESQALEVISFVEPEDYWRLLLPNITTITSITWYQDDHHLFLQYPDGIRFLDVQDQFLEHFPLLTSATTFAYQPDLNRLYFATAGQLLSIDFPK